MSAVSRWDLPTIDGAPVQARRVGKTVAELEEVEQRAYREAYAKGHQAGLAAAQAQMQPVHKQLQEQVAYLESLLDGLSRPLQQLDAQVEEQLVRLALAIARQLVRRELRIEPAQVIAIVRETVGLLPAAARDVRVHLHPQDAAIVREKLSTPREQEGAERAWTLVEDPVMTRGGCRVTTETAQIDARLDTRMQAVIAALLGDERSPRDGSQGDASSGSED